jgi:hypothetical protein
MTSSYGWYSWDDDWNVQGDQKIIVDRKWDPELHCFVDETLRSVVAVQFWRRREWIKTKDVDPPSSVERELEPAC